MPTECSPELFEFAPVEGRAVVAAFDGGAITSDAGALLLGATDRAIGLIGSVCRVLHDARRAELVEHEVATLVGQRVFGIALGYEDLNDHDELRHDPVMAVLAGKLEARRDGLRAGGRQVDAEPAGAEPAGADALSQDQPRSGGDREAVRRSVPGGARASSASRSCSISMPPTIRCTASRRGGSSTAITTATATCRSTCSAAVICWRPSCGASNIDAAAGAVEEVARIVAPDPRRWPRVRILLRGDCGFAREALMAWCEANRVRLPVRPGAATRGSIGDDQGRACAGRGEEPADRQAGAPLQGLQLDDADSWSRERRVIGQGRVDAGRGQSALRRHLAHARRRSRPRISTRRSTAPAARWRTGSRSASSICSPTAPRPPPCAPTSSACGSPRWPMCCSAPCAASACTTPQFAEATCGTIRLKLLKIGALVRISVRRIKVAMASACPAAVDWGAPPSGSQLPPWRAPRPPDTRRRSANITRHNPGPPRPLLRCRRSPAKVPAPITHPAQRRSFAH